MKNPSRDPSDMVSVGPLGYGTDGRSGKQGSPFYYVYCLGVAVLLAQIPVYQVLVSPSDLPTNHAPGATPNYLWFALSLFLVLIGLVNSYLVEKDTSFSDYPYLRYIVKVWLTNIVAAPFIFTTIFILKGMLSGADDIADTYLYWIIGSNGFGMPGFALFGFCVHYISNLHWPKLKKRIVILITAELLTFATVAIFAPRVIPQVNWLLLAVPYALVMGVGTICHKLEEPAPAVLNTDNTTGA